MGPVTPTRYRFEITVVEVAHQARLGYMLSPQMQQESTSAPGCWRERSLPVSIEPPSAYGGTGGAVITPSSEVWLMSYPPEVCTTGKNTTTAQAQQGLSSIKMCIRLFSTPIKSISQFVEKLSEGY